MKSRMMYCFGRRCGRPQKRCRITSRRVHGHHRGASIRWCPASPGVVAGYCVRILISLKGKPPSELIKSPIAYVRRTVAHKQVDLIREKSRLPQQLPDEFEVAARENDRPLHDLIPWDKIRAEFDAKSVSILEYQIRAVEETGTFRSIYDLEGVVGLGKSAICDRWNRILEFLRPWF